MRDKPGPITAIVLSLLLIAILLGIKEGFMSLRNYFSGDFPVGFIAGGAFVFAIVLLAQRLEKSGSREGRSPADE